MLMMMEIIATTINGFMLIKHKQLELYFWRMNLIANGYFEYSTLIIQTPKQPHAPALAFNRVARTSFSFLYDMVDK